jgi:hypothetical protein
MLIKIDSSALHDTKWHEYAIRFLFGGLITGITGIIAKEFGPSIGGLFLAFPAIFPASATLIEKHEKERKQEHGLAGRVRARKATSVDAAGSAMGSVGLFVFALVCWRFLSDYGAGIVLASATLAWFAAAVLTWQIRKHI